MRALLLGCYDGYGNLGCLAMLFVSHWQGIYIFSTSVLHPSSLRHYSTTEA